MPTEAEKFKETIVKKMRQDFRENKLRAWSNDKIFVSPELYKRCQATMPEVGGDPDNMTFKAVAVEVDNNLSGEEYRMERRPITEEQLKRNHTWALQLIKESETFCEIYALLEKREYNHEVIEKLTYLVDALVSHYNGLAKRVEALERKE